MREREGERERGREGGRGRDETLQHVPYLEIHTCQKKVVA